MPLIGFRPEAERIVVEGHGRGSDFVPTVARAPETALDHGVSFLPIDSALLPAWSPKSFGREERASSEIDGSRLLLHCQPGEAPAGLVFEGRLPAGADLKLRIAGSGMPGVMTGFATPGREPRAWRELGAGVTELAPGPAAGDGVVTLTLLCPLQGGALTIEDFRLVAADPDHKVEPRSAWAWKTALWREKADDLLRRASALQIGRLYVSLDIAAEQGVLEVARFANFVSMAHRAGIAVVVVEGDAGMALAKGRQAALARLAAIQRYQHDAPPDARVDGLQYDIEPYLLPGFLTDPETVMRGWAETIRVIRAATTLDLEVVLPFWLQTEANARHHVLPALKDSASAIAIMAYRTDRQQIIEAATPLLSWASEHGLRARVALENGPLDDDVSQTFLRAAKGRLTVETAADGRMRATLLADHVPTGRPTYAFSHESVSPASAVSFLKNSDRFLEAVDQAESTFRAWPAFAGMALHGLIE